jgi:hypothetical protein
MGGTAGEEAAETGRGSSDGSGFFRQLVPSVCSGGGFGFASASIPVAKIGRWKFGLESVGLVEWDTKEGGAHGGILGVEYGPAVLGIESMRTWRDWKVHTGPILIGGDEFSAAGKVFGKKLNAGTLDGGGFASYADGQLSLGGYLRGHVFGGGGYINLSWNGCKP